MKFDSYHRSKTRVSRKQRKTPQMWSGKATPLSFNFNSGREARVGQHYAQGFIPRRAVSSQVSRSAPVLQTCTRSTMPTQFVPLSYRRA